MEAAEETHRFRAAISSLAASANPSLQIVKSFPARPSPSQKQIRGRRRTVCILDSSFNPPTKAHMHLALQALENYKPKSKTESTLHRSSDGGDDDEGDLSLLLLLATTNADKPPAPAAYEHRLAMMCLLAQEIRTIHNPSLSYGDESGSGSGNEGLQVDVGITPHPRFIDKSTDLSLHPFFPPDATRQVWILGYDTLIRLLNPKYYPPHHTLRDLHTTLLSSENRILVFTRPGTEYGTQESQYEYLSSLDKSVAEKVDMVVAGEGVEGVSSTAVRHGVRNGSDGWRSGVCEQVGEWIATEGLYL